MNYFKTKGYGILSRLTRGCSARPLLALSVLIHTSCRESRNSSSASHRGRFYQPTQILTRQVIIYDTIRKALRLRTTFTQTSTLLACQGRDVKKNVMFTAKIRTLKKSLVGLSLETRNCHLLCVFRSKATFHFKDAVLLST